MLAATSFVFGVEPEMNQRVMALARLHDDVAAMAAVAAGRAAAGDKFLAPEGHASIATVASFYSNFNFVQEHFLLVVSVPDRLGLCMNP